MPATVTTLDREIAREERWVGLPTDQPLTDRAIAHRRLQIAAVMLACGFLALFAFFFHGTPAYELPPGTRREATAAAPVGTPPSAPQRAYA